MKKTASPSASLSVVKGGVTAAQGFSANGVLAGIKQARKPDLGVISSSVPCTAAGTFTTNRFRAACVTWNEKALPSRHIQAVIVNSGNANACTGDQGDQDVATTAQALADQLGLKPKQILVASTGIIGEFMPMEKIMPAVPLCVRGLSPTGGRRFASAIMTTDTVLKEYAVNQTTQTGSFTIGGCVKGAGMIHPKMATMLGFITTDVKIDAARLRRIVRSVVDQTFNNLTIDGDTSTNDMVLVLANGLSGVSISDGADEKLFTDALFDVCNTLCSKIAADGEGATKRVEINVTGGATYADCRLAAKAIANSNLVKTALYGNDPNWGRIVCAIGYSGSRFDPHAIEVKLCGTTVFTKGRPARFNRPALSKALRRKIATIDVALGMGGKTCAVAHTCDLSYDYIKINADYHT